MNKSGRHSELEFLSISKAAQGRTDWGVGAEGGGGEAWESPVHSTPESKVVSGPEWCLWKLLT